MSQMIAVLIFGAVVIAATILLAASWIAAQQITAAYIVLGIVAGYIKTAIRRPK
jgi:hypothetical protein